MQRSNCAIVLVILAFSEHGNGFNLTVAFVGNVLDSWLAKRTPIGSLQECEPSFYASNSTSCIGGLWRAKSALDQLRRENPNFLFVVPGGALLGSLFSQVSSGALGQLYLDLLETDVFALGRQELSLPAGTNLTDLRRRSQSLYMNSNLLVASTGEPLAPLFGFSTSAVFSFPDPVTGRIERVGVLAMSHAQAAEETAVEAKAGMKVTIEDPLVTMQREIGAFFDQGINKVIMLHAEASDQELYRSQTGVAGLDFIASVYPKQDTGLVQGARSSWNHSISGRPVLLSRCSHLMREICYATLDFDDAGVLRQSSTQTGAILLNSSVADNTTLLDRVNADYNSEIAPLLSQQLCNSSVVMSSARPLVRFHEAAIGNMMADGIRFTTGADIAVLNGGGIRADVPTNAGQPIDVGTILNALPFGNLLQVATIAGFDLWTLLENSVKFTEVYDPADSRYRSFESNAGRFLQGSGLRFSYFDNATAGDRVHFIQVLNKAGQWKDVDPDAQYTIAINNFMATGGDEYSFFTDPLRSRLSSNFSSVRDAFAVQNYLLHYARTVSNLYSPPALGRIVRDHSRTVPTVQAVLPSEGSKFGNQIVTLIGSGFLQPSSSIAQAVRVRIKGVDCLSPLVINDTALSCLLGDATKPLASTGQVPGAGLARVYVELSPTLWRYTDTSKFRYATVSADCSEGSIFDTVGETCVCRRGYMIQQDLRLPCVACSAGKYADLDNSVNCTDCPAGSFSGVGAIVCSDCSAGTFAPVSGATTCYLCPSFSKTSLDDEPSKKFTNCFCNAPFIPHDKRLPKTGLSYQPDPSVVIEGLHLECLPCPAGANCFARKDIALAARGYWRNPDTGSFLRCAEGLCCQVEACESNSSRICAGSSSFLSVTANVILLVESRVGFMCGGCAEDYNEVSGRCVDCRDTNKAAVVIGLSLLLLLVFIVYLYMRPVSLRATLKILIDYIQMLAFVVERGTVTSSVFDVANMNPQVPENLLQTLICCTALLLLLDEQPWSAQAIFSAGIGACSLKASALNLLALSNLVQVLALYCVLLVVYALDKWVLSHCCQATQRARQARLINAVWLLVLFAFMGLCASAVRLLQCVKLDDRLVLAQSMTIKCWQEPHLTYGLIAAIALAILCLGIPGLVLYQSRKVESKKSKRRTSLERHHQPQRDHRATKGLSNAAVEMSATSLQQQQQQQRSNSVQHPSFDIESKTSVATEDVQVQIANGSSNQESKRRTSGSARVSSASTAANTSGFVPASLETEVGLVSNIDSIPVSPSHSINAVQSHHNSNNAAPMLSETRTDASNTTTSTSNDNEDDAYHDAAYGSLYIAYDPAYYWFEALFMLRRVSFILIAVLLSDVSTTENSPRGAQANVAIVWWCLVLLLLHTHWRVYRNPLDNVLSRQCLLGVASVSAYNVFNITLPSDAASRPSEALLICFLIVVVMLCLSPVLYLLRYGGFAVLTMLNCTSLSATVQNSPQQPEKQQKK